MRRLFGVLTAVALALAMTVLLLIGLVNYLPSPDAKPTGGVDPDAIKLSTNVPGIGLPRLHKASEIRLADADEVIGVAAANEFRAYPIATLQDFRCRILNDVIRDIPISVTYCVQADHVRVLTCDLAGRPIDLHNGGLDRQDLMLYLFNGARYRQSSQEIPLQDYQFDRTSWGQWKLQHSSTLVYAGEIESRSLEGY
ncbi:MAG: DUF3179 domain-containing protein [Planctomycetes bacterium]|nr:DUF3179 domain-containing protein [Planctomycetota bacterium]